MSVKVVRDRVGILPMEMAKDTRIAHVILTNSWVEECKVANEVTSKLRNMVGRIEEFQYPWVHRVYCGCGT